MITAVSSAGLAYEENGAGPEVVFVHGMTFSRATWRPITQRLERQFRCISVDLPGHGDTPGPARPLEQVADALHRSLAGLGVGNPVLVGHSMAALVVSMYAAKYRTAGVVNVDQSLMVQPFAGMVGQLIPALERDFGPAFEPVRRSMGIEMLPEPMRSRTASTQAVCQEIVLGYWRELIDTPAADLQRRIDTVASAIEAPYLVVMGQTLSAELRAHFERLVPHAEIEEWAGRGHMAHLAEPDRFAERVAAFIQRAGAGRVRRAAR